MPVCLMTNAVSPVLCLSVRSFLSSPSTLCWCYRWLPSFVLVVVVVVVVVVMLVAVLAVGVATQRKTGVAPGSLLASGKCQI